MRSVRDVCGDYRCTACDLARSPRSLICCRLLCMLSVPHSSCNDRCCSIRAMYCKESMCSAAPTCQQCARCPIDELATSDKQMTPNKNHRGGVNANASWASGSFARSRLTSIEPGRQLASAKKAAWGRAPRVRRAKDNPPNAADAGQQHTNYPDAANAPAAARAPRPAKRPTRRPCAGARNCQEGHFQSPTAPGASPTPRRAAGVS